MSPDQKPEWFQLADADNDASPRKISKGLPVIALVAVAAILGVGAVMAQTQEESPANATETVAPQTVTTDQSSSTPAVATSNSTATSVVKSTAKNAVSAPSAPAGNDDSVAPASPANNGPANPAIGKLPTGGEREGHDRNHEGGDDDEGEDD